METKNRFDELKFTAAIFLIAALAVVGTLLYLNCVIVQTQNF